MSNLEEQLNRIFQPTTGDIVRQIDRQMEASGSDSFTVADIRKAMREVVRPEQSDR